MAYNLDRSFPWDMIPSPSDPRQINLTLNGHDALTVHNIIAQAYGSSNAGACSCGYF